MRKLSTIGKKENRGDLVKKSGRSTGRLKKLYSLEGTAEILEYLNGHPGCRKRDLHTVASPSTVSKRLHTFLTLGLITRELELTNEGRKYLGTIRKIETLEI